TRTIFLGARLSSPFALAREMLRPVFDARKGRCTTLFLLGLFLFIDGYRWFNSGHPVTGFRQLVYCYPVSEDSGNSDGTTRSAKQSHCVLVETKEILNLDKLGPTELTIEGRTMNHGSVYLNQLYIWSSGTLQITIDDQGQPLQRAPAHSGTTELS